MLKISDRPDQIDMKRIHDYIHQQEPNSANSAAAPTIRFEQEKGSRSVFGNTPLLDYDPAQVGTELIGSALNEKENNFIDSAEAFEIGKNAYIRLAKILYD